jgi:hypothetical protein
LIAALLALAVIAAALLPAAPVAAQDGGYTYAECAQADAATIEQEIAGIAHVVLDEAAAGIDLDALVSRAWTTVDAGTALDAAVDAAVEQVRGETAYANLFLSGWSVDHAQALTARVAETAFASPMFQSKLEELSTAVALGLVAEMDAYTARSASSALLCLQAYVGERYSETLFTALAGELDQDVPAAVGITATVPVAIAPLQLHTKGLTGIGVIIAGQVTQWLARRLATTVAERLAGKIVGRVLGKLGSSVVPYIGWVVGVGLVVWDLVEGSQGALPQIRDALRSPETHLAVQAEVAAAVRDGLASEVDGLAGTLAATLLEQWRGLCATLGDLCVLAISYPTFGALLDATDLADLPRLARLAALFRDELGAPALTAALADGSFAELLAAPEEAYAILRWSRSPQTTLAWVAVAGDVLPAVVDHGIYREIVPDTLSSLALAALAAIGDNTLIHKLLALPASDLTALLQLPTPDLQVIAAGATPEDLGWLAAQIAASSTEAAAELGHRLAQGEQTIAVLRQHPATATPAPLAVAAPPATPVTAQPERPLNGVVVASGMILVLLVGLGVFLAIRSDHDGTA